MVIITTKYGQLGNRLFPFAQFIAHAHKHHYRVLNLAFEDYAENFYYTEKSLFCSYPAFLRVSFFTKEIRRIIFGLTNFMVRAFIKIHFLKSPFHEIILGKNPQVHFYSDEGFIELVKSKKIVIICNPFYFRDDATLHEHLGVVLDFLRITDSHSKNVSKLISKMRKDCEIIVGMHIRGGDFRTWMDGAYFYDIHYFQEAIDQMKLLLKSEKVGFLICSNEKWDPALFNGANVYFGPGQIVEDLFALSKADFLIGGYSSYLYWASLSGGAPIYSFAKENIFEKPMKLSDFKNIQEFGSIP
jgi:hypothetical protein